MSFNSMTFSQAINATIDDIISNDEDADERSLRLLGERFIKNHTGVLCIEKEIQEFKNRHVNNKED